MLKIPNDTENITTPHIKSKPHAMQCAIEIKCNYCFGNNAQDPVKDTVLIILFSIELF